MKKNVVIEIILVFVIIFSIAIFWFLSKSPSTVIPSHSACGIEFKLIGCNYYPQTMKADVKIQLIDGEITGFNGRIRNVDESQKVQGFITDQQLIQMNNWEIKNFQFNFNFTSDASNGPFKIEIDPLDSNQEICLSGAQIPCG